MTDHLGQKITNAIGSLIYLEVLLLTLFTQVNHSQKARETPLKTWVLAEKNGTVINAHCNCMAGQEVFCVVAYHKHCHYYYYHCCYYYYNYYYYYYYYYK